MKNNFKVLALLFISAFSLSSCSSDDSGESNGTTNGDYFPTAVNNKWQYTNGSDATEINLVGTANFDGTTYYEFTDTDAQVSIQEWIGKKGATYFEKAATSTITQSGTTFTIQGYEIKMFRDDLAVGETWSGSAKPKITYSGGSTTAYIEYEGQITARDISVTLGGITYNNVIKMQLNITETVNGQVTTISGENWFAKDIGLIYDSTTTSNDGVTRTRYLTSYTLN